MADLKGSQKSGFPDVIIRDGIDSGTNSNTGEKVIGSFVPSDTSPTGTSFIDNKTGDTKVVVDNYQGGKTNTVPPTNPTKAIPSNPCLNIHDYGYVLWD